MIRMISLFFMGILFSTWVEAKNYEGKFFCIPNVVNEKAAGDYQGVTISGADSKNVEMTVLGESIVVDLAEASNAVLTSVAKKLTNPNVFDGEISLFLSFQYEREIKAGNLVGFNLYLEHMGKTFWGNDITWAKSMNGFPLVTGAAERVELFSSGGRLLLVKVVCGFL